MGLLILPSVSTFSPTIRRTARIYVLPIEPNLAERAKISAINLDYQLDPVTPPPSPSSPFSMASYQRMIAETDPIQREEALTAYGTETGQSSVLVPETALTPRVNKVFIGDSICGDEMITQLRTRCVGMRKIELEWPRKKHGQRGKEALESGPAKSTMLNQLIATRVAEALAAAVVTHAASTQEETNLGSNSSQNKACNYKEFRAVMHENFHGTEGAIGLTRWFEKLEFQFRISNVAEGDRVKFASSTLLDSALTWWNVYVRYVTLDTAHATPCSDFKAMVIQKYCPRNEIKQMENELWNLKVKDTNLTAYNQRFQEHMPLNALKCVDDTTLTHALLPVTTVEGQDIRSKTVEPHPVPQAKEDSKAKEDREVMLLALDVAKRDTTRTCVRTMEVNAVEIKFEATNKILRTIRGRIKETLREITKHQPALKEDAEHLAEYTAYVLRLL
ncbi:reverse transcriptase domain-containing protein [Tanacetum coccineum]